MSQGSVPKLQAFPDRFLVWGIHIPLTLLLTLKTLLLAGWWLTPVIVATQEAEIIRRIAKI
jgi:hypothetical protein